VSKQFRKGAADFACPFLLPGRAGGYTVVPPIFSLFLLAF
jgi:hypothetical protein